MKVRCFLAALGALVALAPAGWGALSADRLLENPPSARDLADPARARQRLADVERQIQASPDRRAELEVYAIPFRRALEASPAGKAGAAAPGRTYWILVNAPSGPTILRALSATRQGSAVVIEDEQHRRSVWDRLRILGALPWLSDRDFATLSAAQVQQIIRQYQARAQANPRLRPPLLAEAERIRVTAEKAAVERTARQRALDAWLAETLQLSADTRSADLATHVLAGEKLRADNPSAAAQIDAATAPYAEALKAFWSGKVFDGAGWLDGRDARQFQDAAKLKAAREKLIADFHLKVGAVTLPPDRLRSFLQWTFGANVVAIIVGILLFLSRGLLLRVAGFLLFAAGVGFAVYWYWPLLGEPPARSAAETTGRAEPVLEVLANSGQVKMGFPLRTPAQRSVILPEEDLNAFLRDRVTVEADAKAEGLVRKAVAARVQGGHLIVDEDVDWRGRPFLVSYDFPAQAGKTGAQLGEARVSVNGVVLSNRSAEPFRESMRILMGHAESETSVRLAYQLAGLQPGKIELAARGPAPTPVPTPTPPPATPAPTATPVPTPTPDPDAELYELLGQDKFGNPLPPKKTP